jgi:hypothetical protein
VIRGVFVALSLVGVFSLPHTDQAWAQDSSLLKYKFSKTAVRCLKDNKASISAMTSSPIILDVRFCPPRGTGIDSLGDVRASGVPSVPRMSGEDLDYLLIIPSTETRCYFSVIDSVNDTDTEVVTLDFSPCAKRQ